jgi:transcriptional regulator GlxA family with amidase domain
MQAAILVFDDFTDIDVFLPWDLLNRARARGLTVRLLGERARHRSATGLELDMHGRLEDLAAADMIVVPSGAGVRAKYRDDDYLRRLAIDPARQLVGSMCSGALLLAALGLLKGRQATTYPTSRQLLEAFDVEVVERPFVVEGNVATAAGCLAAQQLVGWMLERALGAQVRADVLRSVQPVGEGLFFADTAAVTALYAPLPQRATTNG